MVFKLEPLTEERIAELTAHEEARRARAELELRARIAQLGQHFARSGWSPTATVRLSRSARAWGWR